MAPEQARDSQAADIRSDIYSLGCTWYQMLTGEPPYPNGSVTNKLYAHASKPRPDPRALNRSVPEEVVIILHRMMAQAGRSLPVAGRHPRGHRKPGSWKQTDRGAAGPGYGRQFGRGGNARVWIAAPPSAAARAEPIKPLAGSPCRAECAGAAATAQSAARPQRRHSIRADPPSPGAPSRQARRTAGQKPVGLDSRPDSRSRAIAWPAIAASRERGHSALRFPVPTTEAGDRRAGPYNPGARSCAARSRAGVAGVERSTGRPSAC